MKFLNFSIVLIFFIISAADHADENFKEENMLYYIKDMPVFSQEMRQSAISDAEKIGSKDVQPGPQITVNIIFENSPKMIKNVDDKTSKNEFKRGDKHPHYQQFKRPFSHHSHNGLPKMNASGGNKSLNATAIRSIINFLKSLEQKAISNVSSHLEEMKNERTEDVPLIKTQEKLFSQIINGSLVNKLQSSTEKSENDSKIEIKYKDREHVHSNQSVSDKIIDDEKRKVLPKMQNISDGTSGENEKPKSHQHSYLPISDQEPLKLSQNLNLPGLNKQSANDIDFDDQPPDFRENDIGESSQNQDYLYIRSQPLASLRERQVEGFHGFEPLPLGHHPEAFQSMLRELYKREIRIPRDRYSFENESSTPEDKLASNKTGNETDIKKELESREAYKEGTILEDPFLKKEVVLHEINQDISNDTFPESPRAQKSDEFPEKPKVLASIQEKQASLNVSDINKLEEPKVMMSIDLKKSAINESTGGSSEFMKDYDEFELQKRRLPLLIAPPQPKAEVKSQPDFPGVWNRVLPYLAILKRDANNSDLTSPAITDQKF